MDERGKGLTLLAFQAPAAATEDEAKMEAEREPGADEKEQALRKEMYELTGRESDMIQTVRASILGTKTAG